ncbi:hypothetical protein [Burkholderia cenocepacia]|uniref:hypothetical protein n=1 Tax=Burkholderia cenocepacia TaxID=95486 RepID=UPI000761AC57|nr:hypothetical protein [Burkholderia cenocepacia]KWU19152.1 hypothetical protein AS149_12960 [Burkholderia cenocepacia]
MPHIAQDANGVQLHDFNHSLKTEALVDAALRKTFGDALHLDYRTKPEAQKMGFDYLLRWTEAGEVQKAAVDDKADARLKTTGNLSLELFTLSARRSCADGWLIYGKPLALRYVSVDSGEVLILPLSELREFVMPRLDDFDTVGVVNNRGDVFSHITFNSLVPAAVALQNCPGASIVLLEGAVPVISKGFEDRVLGVDAALSTLSGKGMYSKAVRGLSVNQMQQRLLANRFAHTQEKYLAQCQLPKGLLLQTELPV